MAEEVGTSGESHVSSERYLCYFLHRHLDFRLSEVESVAAMYGCSSLKWHEPFGGGKYSPFWYVDLPSQEIARQIAARSLLVKVHYPGWLILSTLCAGFTQFFHY